MLTPPDLLRLPCTPDLIESGTAHACRSLAQAGSSFGGRQIGQMRQSGAEVAVELAFRRHLSGQGVPFGVLEATPFTDPDHFDVTLGGHRCLLTTCLVRHRRQIARLRCEPGLLLQAPALLPLDEYTAEGHKPDDIHLFAFLLGLEAASQEDMERAQAAGQPVYLVHPLPARWAHPSGWIPLRELALKSECEQTIPIELGGQDEGRNFATIRLDLPPRERILVPDEFYSLTHLRAERRPERRIGIHCPAHGEAHIIAPFDWGNLWVYGMDILLAGWMTRADFRRKATVLNPGMSTMLQEGRGEKNLLLPVAELNPLGPLFSKVKAWSLEQALR